MIELFLALTCSNITVPSGLPSPFVQTLLKDYSNYTLIIYGINEGIPCAKLRSFLEYLSSLYGFKVVWVPLRGGTPRNATAVRVAEAFGLSYVPITGVYCRNRLVAVVVGDVENETFWLDEVMRCTNETQVFKGQKFLGAWRSSPGPLEYHIFVLALIDSLNPIGLTVFTFYILSCKNIKKNCVRNAASFIVAYTFAHVALGMSLSLLPASPYYPVVGIFVSSMVIISLVRPSRKLKLLTSWASTVISSLVVKRTSPIILGLLAGSVGTSPCVLGAFLSAASLAGSNLSVWAAYAAIYATVPSAVFVMLDRGVVVDPKRVVLPLATVSLLTSIYLTAVNFGFLHP